MASLLGISENNIGNDGNLKKWLVKPQKCYYDNVICIDLLYDCNKKLTNF